MSKKLKYKLGDVVYLKKKSDPREAYPELHKHTKFTIVEVDDDSCPYLVQFATDDDPCETYWLVESEIKRLASVVHVGGE